MSAHGASRPAPSVAVPTKLRLAVVAAWTGWLGDATRARRQAATTPRRAILEAILMELLLRNRIFGRSGVRSELRWRGTIRRARYRANPRSAAVPGVVSSRFPLAVIIGT